MSLGLCFVGPHRPGRPDRGRGRIAAPSKSGGNMPKRRRQGNRARAPSTLRVRKRKVPGQAGAGARRQRSQNTASTTMTSSGADARLTAAKPSVW